MTPLEHAAAEILASRPDDALGHLDAYFENNPPPGPDLAFALALRGEAQRMNSRNYDEESEDFAAAISADDGTLAARWHHGISFSYALSKAKPADGPAQRGLGEALLRRGDGEEALEFLEAAAALLPEDAYARALRGEARFRCLRWIGAFADFAAAVALDENGGMRRRWNAGRFFRLYCKLNRCAPDLGPPG